MLWRVQLERHDEMQGWVLTTIKACANIPNVFTTVPEFKAFIDSKVLRGKPPIPARYKQLSVQHLA